MKNHISLKSVAVVLFSSVGVHSDSMFFTQAGAQCQASWVQVAGPCTFFFPNYSTGSTANTTWNWTFGDGETSDLKEPWHTYSVSGTYSVCLTMYDSSQSPICNNTSCKNIPVQCATGIALASQIDISLSVNNPVFTSADIHYSIPAGGSVKLSLFDIVGNKISILENASKSGGMYSYLLNTGILSKGIYFIHLDFSRRDVDPEGATITKKIIIVR